jgi:adenylosuccinate lyase
LLTELEREATVTRHLDAARLRQLTDPANYLGSALGMVDRVLAECGRAPSHAPLG